MHDVSIWHWIIMLLVAFVWVFPFWKLLPRAGIPKWVALVAIFPLFALILLWIVALKPWSAKGSI